MDTVTTAIISIITAFASAFTTYFFTRKKYNSEVDNNNIQNMTESLEFYTTLSNDNTERLKKTLEDYEKLSKQCEQILKENNNLRLEIMKLKTIIINLTSELKEFNKNGTKAK